MFTIKKAIHYIFAEEEDFSLENRLFLSAIVFGLLTCVVGTIVNLILIASLRAVIVPVSLSFLLLVLYYFVRVKRIFGPLIVPSIIIALIAISITWLLNGGINGSHSMPGFVILILGLIVYPQRLKKYVIMLFIALNIIIYLIQFYRPDLVTNNQSETERWFDSLITLIYTSFFIFLIVQFIHKQYALERLKSEEGETKFRLSDTNLEEAQRIAHIGSWEWDIISDKVTWSKEMYRVFDISPDTFDGKSQSLLKTIHPLDIECYTQSMFCAESEDHLPSLEYRVIHQDGSIHNLFAVRRIEFDNAGKPVRSNGIVQDITERKQAEEALKKSENFLKEAQIIANLGIYTLDIATERWISSEVLDNIFGIDNDFDKSFEGWASIIHPEWQDVMYHYFIDEVLGNKTNFDKEYKIIRQNDGAERWLHGLGMLKFNEDNQAITMLGTIRDITDLKHSEQELTEAKERAEESDRLKSAFLANMSHEIRTPMNGILGFAELLKTPDLSGEEKQEYIQIIKKSGDRMLNIINEIVDISKIESKQMNISVSETKINEQTEFIYTFLKPDAEKKGILLVCKNGLPEEKAVINTDREKLYAVLTNLVKNAIKYTDSGIIEFGYVLKRPVGTLSELEFYVKDTGIGIPANRLQAIFDRFIQADISDIRAFQGAGLGLSISKAYVEMLGGKIRVESKEGQGSVFYFTLPYTDDEKEERKNSVEISNHKVKATDQIRSLKILIAEDDETSVFLLTMALKDFIGKAINVKTGVEAVEACWENPDIDLVLMDINMPLMDGYEATRQIRKFNKNLIIIAQTAYGMIDDKKKAIDAGCSDYIAKPLNIALLIEMIVKHLKTK